MTHICVSKLTIIGSDNGLSPGRRQAIICTNDGILVIGALGTNFSEMLIEIHTFLFKKIHLKMSSEKWRPFCLGLNVLTAGYLWKKMVMRYGITTHLRRPNFDSDINTGIFFYNNGIFDVNLTRNVRYQI